MFNFSDTRIRFLVLILLLAAGFYFFQFSPGQVAAILYPNTGGTFETGKPLEIRWTPGSPGIQGIELITPDNYQKYGSQYGYYGDKITVYYKQEYAYNSTGGDTSGSYSFVPSVYGVPAGSYYVRIVGANNSGIANISNVPITFVGSTIPSSPPSSSLPPILSYPSPVSSVPATPVKVISPNGGETFTIDGSIRISWSGGKNKVQVAIAKGDYRPGTGDSHMGWITKNGVPNSYVFWDGNICVTPDYCRPVTYWQPSGLVKILVVSENDQGDICIQADRPCNLDVSDAPFTVKSRDLLPLPSLKNTPPPLELEKPSLIEVPQPKKTPVSPSSQRKIIPSTRPVVTPMRTKKSSSSNETPLLTVISPNGGETFAPGSSMKISWSSENTLDDMLVNIYLFSKNPEEHKDYIWTANIASYAKNNSILNWKIPQDIKPGNRYFLRIGCQYPQGTPYQGCTTDDSDNAFSIGNGTSPAGGTIEQPPLIEEKTITPSANPEQRNGFFEGLWGRMKSVFGY